METFWEFAGNFWWLVFPLGGMIGGTIGGFQKAAERRRRDKLELFKLKQAERLEIARLEHAKEAAAADAEESLTSEIERVLADHEETNRRWLDYELDAIKVLEYPLMTDMREQVTVDYHRAKRDADGLRPDDPEELRNRRRLDQYRKAVREYQITFDIAEREARRRRATSFTVEERRQLERAKQLLAMAEDTAASSAERQSAYRQALKEIEGLIVLPEAATEAIEQSIAGTLGAGPGAARPEDAGRGSHGS